MKTTNNFDKIKEANVHKFHRRRLREELLQTNFNVVNEHKLLEYLLFYCHVQKDVNPLAHKLIDKFGSFSNVLEASYNDLIKVEGVGETTACFLTSLIPVFEFYKNQKINNKQKLNTTKDYVSHFGDKIKNESVEKILIILLSNRYEIKKSIVLSQGDEHAVTLNFDNVYKALANSDSNKLILMHNHPSGNPMPSSEDLTNTQDIYGKLKFFNKTLVDHIIVASTGYYSFKESGVFEKYEDLLKNGFKFFINPAK